MKLKKVKYTKSNYIKFELMKLKILQRYSDKYTLKSKIEQLASFLKKALKVITEYHLERKKILFIGIPQTIQSHYIHQFKATKHTFLPESYSTTNLLTNKFITLKDLKDKSRSHIFNETRIKLAKNRFLLKKQFDLIVVVNPTSLFSLMKKEVLKLKIPMVVLTLEEMSLNEEYFYLIPGSLSDLDKLKITFLLRFLKPIFKKCRPLHQHVKKRRRPLYRPVEKQPTSHSYMKFKKYKKFRKENPYIKGSKA